MDKKMLRQLPRPTTLPEYYEMARESDARWLMHVSEISGVMQMAVWSMKGLRTGKRTTAVYRIFAAEDDYITQDLTVDKTKWKTGKLWNVLEIWYSNYGWTQIVFDGDQSRQVFERRFQPVRRSWWKEGIEASPFESFSDWQNRIMHRKLNARHDKELTHTREMMELVPELPADFDEWIHDYGMRSRRYLIYDGDSRKKEREAFCTECGQHMVIDPKKVRLRMNEWGECPVCGSPVRMKTIKRWHGYESTHNDVTIVQKLEDGRLLFRCFAVYYVFRKQEVPVLRISKEQSVYEYARVFMNGREWESYEHTEYKQSRRVCWCPDTGKIKTYEFIIRRDGLRGFLSGTPYQYSGLEVLQEKEEFQHIEIFRYLRAYEKCPQLEILVKAGLTRLVHEALHDILYWHAKSFLKDLGELAKNHLRMLKNLNGGIAMVHFLRRVELNRIEISESDLEEFMEAFGPTERILQDITIHGIQVRRFTRYVRKETGRRKKDISARLNFMNDWRDYMAWCEELGYDLKDDYVLMPPHFQKTHDRVLKELNDMRDEKARKAMEEIDRLIREQVESTKEGDPMDPMRMASKKFLIRLPATAEDLKREGQTLHHCVATYADRVAKKQTMILFIRKAEAPEEPFFTMEWRDNKVIQCRGSHNCDMPADVKAFVKAFEKRMHQAGKKQERVKVRAC